MITLKPVKVQKLPPGTTPLETSVSYSLYRVSNDLHIISAQVVRLENFTCRPNQLHVLRMLRLVARKHYEYFNTSHNFIVWIRRPKEIFHALFASLMWRNNSKSFRFLAIHLKQVCEIIIIISIFN